MQIVTAPPSCSSNSGESTRRTNLCSIGDQTPGQPDPMVELAWLERQAGRTEQARQILHQVIAATPNHPRALTELASIYESNHESDRALALYQRALPRIPTIRSIEQSGRPARFNGGAGADRTIANNPFSPPDSSRASRDLRFQMR